jgi:hypothetical protein
MWKHRDFLVKALISSYFKQIISNASCKYNGMYPFIQESSLPFSWYLY